MKKLFFLLPGILLLSSCALFSQEPSNGTGVIQTGGEAPISTGSVGSGAEVPALGSGSSAMLPTPTRGTGTHILALFSDFECPYCIQAHTSILPLFETYIQEGRLTIEYYQYPLIDIHKNALGDAIAALCAAEQNMFFEYADELYTMEEQKKGTAVSNEDRIAIAGNVKALDTTVFSECVTTNKYEAQVQKDMELGDSMKLEAVPSFYIDGKKLDISGFSDVETFKKFMDTLLLDEKK